MREVIGHFTDQGVEGVLAMAPEAAGAPGRAGRHRRAGVNGWRHKLRSRHLRPGPMLRGDWTAESGYRLGWQLLRRGQPPTAVFVANDLMAIGFIRAMHEANVRVPQDMSVVGFDGIPGVAYLVPPLTTVRRDLNRRRRQCIDMLLAHLHRSPAEFPPAQPVLVVRDSARPPG